MLMDCSISYNKIYWESCFRRYITNRGGLGEFFISDVRTPRAPPLAAATPRILLLRCSNLESPLPPRSCDRSKPQSGWHPLSECEESATAMDRASPRIGIQIKQWMRSFITRRPKQHQPDCKRGIITYR